MHKRLVLGLGGLGLSLSLLGGCAGQPPKPPSRQASAYALAQKPDYTLETFSELVSYLGYLAKLQPAQRQAECEWLKRFNALAPGPGAQLHLAFALLLAPECSGKDWQQASKWFEAGAARAQDPPIRNLLAYHAALAQQRLNAERSQEELARNLERRWRRANQRLNQRLQICDRALKDTRAKLEALKAIEQNLSPSETP